MAKKPDHLERLRSRISRGISREKTNPRALSRKAEVDYETTRDILAGIRDPRWTTACKLLEALGEP